MWLVPRSINVNLSLLLHELHSVFCRDMRRTPRTFL